MPTSIALKGKHNTQCHKWYMSSCTHVIYRSIKRTSRQLTRLVIGHLKDDVDDDYDDEGYIDGKNSYIQPVRE